MLTPLIARHLILNGCRLLESPNLDVSKFTRTIPSQSTDGTLTGASALTSLRDIS